jgi:hypothetical protein
MRGRKGNSRGTGVAALLVLQLPQLEAGQEVRAARRRSARALVGGRGALERPLARILHRQRGGDDAHLVEAASARAATSMRATRGSSGRRASSGRCR